MTQTTYGFNLSFGPSGRGSTSAHLVREKDNQMESLTSYKVNVLSAGHTIVYKNRAVRTPVVFKIVYEHELSLLESQLNSRSLDYTKHENKETEDDKAVDVIEQVAESNDVQIEELYPKEKEPKSIMDKLISEND